MYLGAWPQQSLVPSNAPQPEKLCAPAPGSAVDGGSREGRGRDYVVPIYKERRGWDEPQGWPWQTSCELCFKWVAGAQRIRRCCKGAEFLLSVEGKGLVYNL